MIYSLATQRLYFPDTLSWRNRCHTVQRTLGGIFYELCDEVNELDCAVA